MADSTVWALLSYSTAANAALDEAEATPTRYDCGTYRARRVDLPFGGWVGQGEPIEVCRKITVEVGSTIYKTVWGAL